MRTALAVLNGILGVVGLFGSISSGQTFGYFMTAVLFVNAGVMWESR